MSVPHMLTLLGAVVVVGGIIAHASWVSADPWGVFFPWVWILVLVIYIFGAITLGLGIGFWIWEIFR